MKKTSITSGGFKKQLERAIEGITLLAVIGLIGQILGTPIDVWGLFKAFTLQGFLVVLIAGWLVMVISKKIEGWVHF